MSVQRRGARTVCTCQGDALPHPPALCIAIRKSAARTKPVEPAPVSEVPPGWAARQAAQPNPHLIIEK